ncbi:hypothetical protein GCM10011366_23730 [Ornithinimicrobium tianjinense]|uniref:Uncharacterized protein n=1 Tax=Ornithinimicrobium tianjinense TaxID=1195761 RepID=A0A917BQC7_9MICO|nr:hypothetical protein GCM10011366_23730 [Ornithinimicrobium tianjinense]
MARRRPEDGPRRDVGLALRADRRRRGQSQRAYADQRELSPKVLATAEVDAGSLSLASLLHLLQGTGYALAVVPSDHAATAETQWEPTDLVATTRSGSRFPPHREVRESDGPLWWWYHEMMGRRGSGRRPGWTAEGFTPPPGTRYGKKPRPTEEDEPPRWPY